MMKRGTLAKLIAGWLLLAPFANAYYFFVHYASRNAPYNVIVEKFDSNALPEKTVTYLISDQGPTKFADGDSYSAVVSQIRAAASIWNAVETSDLRLRFGGYYSVQSQVAQNTPGIDIVFDDLEPGVFGRGGPIVRGDQVGSASIGTFVPILRSQITLQKDLSQRPSWGELFFQTVVHEIGHALGLQHSTAAGAMSQDLQRTTSKSAPLTKDDVAGISTLYPTKAYKELFGSIAGRVTLGGTGVALASVTAIVAKGPAISTFTNPDGTYRIDGIPQGSYNLYASMPPPTINLVLPKDNANREFDLNAVFDSVFFLGLKSLSATLPPTNVAPGEVKDNWNFSVQRRSVITLYDIQTYSYPGQILVRPAFITTYSLTPEYLSLPGNRNFSYVRGDGVLQNGQPAGLQIAPFGEGLAAGSLKAVTADYMQVDWLPRPSFLSEGTDHLIFNRNGEIFVLPNGLHIVLRPPPSITALTTGTDASSGSSVILVAGTNLSLETKILFDGFTATNKSIDDQGRLIIATPNAPGGSKSWVTAANPDGQSSLFVQSPVLYAFDGVDNSSIVVANTSLPAGSDSVIQVDGINTGFDANVTAGFSSTDLFVKKIYVVNPNRLLIQVSVAAGAQPGVYALRLTTGLKNFVQAQGLTVAGPNPKQLTISVPGNVQAYQAGAPGTLNVVNLPDNATNPSLFIGNVQVSPVAVLGGSITFTVPANLSNGPALARLQYNGDSSQSIILTIAPLTQITSLLAGPGFPVDANRPARLGEQLSMIITGLPENFGTPKQVTINIAGIEHKPVGIAPFGSAVQVQFFLKSELNSGVLPMTVTLDALTTPAYNIPVLIQK